jgi:hypothetical protein
MKKTFVESTGFTEWVADRNEPWDKVLAELQQELMADPDAGDVMPGCGGLRKIRVPDPGRGKGKRGGARVIYLHVPEADWVFLLDGYDKGEKDDLSPAEKKALVKLVAELKAEAVEATRKRERK